MAAMRAENSQKLPKVRFDEFLRLLAADGYEVIGPRLDQEAIVYGPIRSTRDLPVGWTDRQAPGSYRLQKRDDEAYFGFAVGPHSWKKYLFPSSLTLWKATRTEDGFEVDDPAPEPPRRAFLGVRACELQGIYVQDLVFLDRAESYTDPYYAKARERVFLIAVECEHPAESCFCTSMGTGPAVSDEHPRPNFHDMVKDPSGRIPLPEAKPVRAKATERPYYDLVLTELDDAFVVRAGSDAGRDFLNRLRLETAAAAEREEAARRVRQAAEGMNRKVDITDLRNLLHRNQEHPRWDDAASRCLSCTNCTLVCPTCFCSGVADATDVSLEHAERVRSWDSCFNPDFAQVHGGNFRPSIRGRYRQWLTHKFASWHDQFGLSGCVGCGRCITWCPVGIDVTEEITTIRSADGQLKESGK